MAIKKTVDFKGISIKYAYIRVITPTINEDKKSMMFSVVYSADPGAAIFDRGGFECSYAIDGPNPIKQGYEYIKTLEQFSGSEDC